MKILIIDDDVSATITLKALLMSQDNFEIDIANSGPDGLNKMRSSGPYQLLILDVMMPDFSGLDVCRAMKKEETLKNIPVILASALPISSLELKDMLDEFYSLCSIIGVVEKPFVMAKLLEAIRKL
jgi:DNA-binding response OmpR family regulator